ALRAPHRPWAGRGRSPRRSRRGSARHRPPAAPRCSPARWRVGPRRGSGVASPSVPLAPDVPTANTYGGCTMCAASFAPCAADVNHPGAPQPCGREGAGPGAPADYVTWYLQRRFSTTEDRNVASAYASSSYSMPGMWVTERTVQVQLDWAAPDGERIDLFIRELVDPDRGFEDLPLLIYLQG